MLSGIKPEMPLVRIAGKVRLIYWTYRPETLDLKQSYRVTEYSLTII